MTHVHVATAGFIAATAIAAGGVAWYGVRRGCGGAARAESGSAERGTGRALNGATGRRPAVSPARPTKQTRGPEGGDSTDLDARSVVGRRDFADFGSRVEAVPPKRRQHRFQRAGLASDQQAAAGLWIGQQRTFDLREIAR
jgi:hypothetical protein